IERSSVWMNRLIQDLLDVASIESGRLALELHEEAPALLLERAREMFEPMAREGGIALEVRMVGEVPPIVVDAQRILQVLGNLVANAIKFTPSGGRVTMRASADGSTVAFAVED